MHTEPENENPQTMQTTGESFLEKTMSIDPQETPNIA
jgi:hypothetical protein